MGLKHRTDITAKMLASSINEAGERIDTLVAHYPRIVHAELMTHRVFSRNTSSSRAIPVSRMLARTEAFIPNFKHNKSGMQPAEDFDAGEQAAAAEIWLRMMKACREGVAELAELGVHKQWANRPTEWFGYVDVVISATQWTNWDGLRLHHEAQDEIQLLARAIETARADATPVELEKGEWHLPYVDEEDRDVAMYVARTREREHPEISRALASFDQMHGNMRMLPLHQRMQIVMSAARSCRVSYARHDGERPTPADDADRFLGLAYSAPKHASPLEHQARPFQRGDAAWLQGNFTGWAQFRKFVPQECL